MPFIKHLFLWLIYYNTPHLPPAPLLHPPGPPSNPCFRCASTIITTLPSFSGLLLVAPLHLSLRLFSLFSMPISATSAPDNYDLVGAGGADGGVGAWGGRGGKGVWGVTRVRWWRWGLEGEERGKEGGVVGWGGLLLLDC